MKKKNLNTIFAALLTALCWTSLCLDWDLVMYLSGLGALGFVWASDSKSNFPKKKETA